MKNPFNILQPRSAWHLKISRFFVASEVVGVYSNTYQGWPSSICSQGKSCRVAFLTRDWTWHLKEAEMSECSTWCWTFSFETSRLWWITKTYVTQWDRFMSCSMSTRKISQHCGHPKQRTCRAAHPSFPCAASIRPGSRESMPWSRSNSSMSKYYGFLVTDGHPTSKASRILEFFRRISRLYLNIICLLTFPIKCVKLYPDHSFNLVCCSDKLCYQCDLLSSAVGICLRCLAWLLHRNRTTIASQILFQSGRIEW